MVGSPPHQAREARSRHRDRVVGHALLACEVWVIVAALGVPRSFGFALVAEGAVKFIGTVFAFVPGQLGAPRGPTS